MQSFINIINQLFTLEFLNKKLCLGSFRFSRSGALSGKMIVENNKIDAFYRQVRLGKG